MEEPMNAIGVVIKTGNGIAQVVFKRSTACGDCHVCASFGDGNAVVELKNTLNAKNGDRVRVQLHSGAVFKASLILYGIPLIALLTGVFFGSRINDFAAALIGIASAVVSLLAVSRFEPKFRRKNSFEPRMIELL